MNFFRSISIFLLLLFTITLFAQEFTISGKITDEKSEGLPFANVFLKGTTTGTTTNIDGNYELKLPKGEHQLMVKYLSYETHEMTINLTKNTIINITLKQNSVDLSEVVITPDGEDPAYRIIREAIKNRQKFQRMIQNYSCEAYTKQIQRILEAPDKVMGQNIDSYGVLDSNNQGIVYLSESISDFSFERPDKTNEVVKSSKVSGNNQGFSWNSAADFLFDFNDSRISVEGLSEQDFVSPIGNGALNFYKYELLGVIKEGKNELYKIKIIPKRKTDPVFEGEIFILKKNYRLVGTDLLVTKEAPVNFVDTLIITQQMMEINDSIWMPFSQRFDFKFGVSFLAFKFKGAGYYVGVFNNYKVNQNLEKGTFSSTIQSFEDNSNEKDSVYWQKVRPVPLTNDEISDYEIKDSLSTIWKSKEFLDSIDRAENKFKPFDVLTGYSFRKRYKKLNIRIPGLLTSVNYNIVEGLVLNIDPQLAKRFKESQKRLIIQPIFRYGFNNERFNVALKTDFLFDRMNNNRIKISGGSQVLQYNNQEPISEFINTGYALFNERNYMKIYEERFAEIQFSRRLFNLLKVSLNGKYTDRIPLQNTTDYTWIDKDDRTFTSNNPLDNDSISTPIFARHQGFITSLSLGFQPGLKYIERPNRKIALGSKYPTFTLQYTKAIPLDGLELDYDKLGLTITDDMKIGSIGTLDYKVKGELFLTKKNVQYPDLFHFNGNKTLFGSNYLNGFQLLDYYSNSTAEMNAQYFVEHHFNGFIWNKIPGLNKLKWQFVASHNGLLIENETPYFEYGLGIEKILQTMRMDFFISTKQQEIGYGFRLGLGF